MITTTCVLAVFLALCGYKLSVQRPGGTTNQDFLPFRGLFALVIVTDHLSQEMAQPGAIIAFSYTGYIIVSLFFAISGYGLAYSVKNKPSYLDGFVVNRIPRLLMPLWLTNLVYILVELLVYKRAMSPGLFVGYLLGYPQINTNAWYVIALFVLYIIFFVALKLTGELKKAIPLIALLTAAWGIFCLTVVKKYWWMNACFAFSAGIILYEYEDKLRIKWGQTLVLLGVFFAAFLCGWKLQGIPMLAAMVIASVASAVLFFAFAKGVRIRGRSLEFLGTISYELYLIHNLYRHLFKSELVRIENDITYYIIVLGSSIISAVLIHQAVMLCFRKKLDKRAG